MDPYNKFVSDEQGYRMLSDVVFHQRHGPEEVLVPPRVPSQTVDRFLNDKLKPGLAPEPVDRAGDIARFYHRPQAAKLFLALLNRKEKTANDLRVSINALRAVGNLGDDGQQKLAADYYAYLLTHPQFDAVAGPMIELLFHLPLVPAKPITDTLTARLARLAAAEKDKDNPSREFTAAERHLHALLPGALGSRAAKEKILAIKDPAAQAKAVARCYVGLDAAGAVDWYKWSAFQLMTIVLVAGPDAAIAGLHAAYAAILPGEDAEFRAIAIGRALKAIVFFGGQLSEEQREALARDATRRSQLQG